MLYTVASFRFILSREIRLTWSYQSIMASILVRQGGSDYVIEAKFSQDDKMGEFDFPFPQKQSGKRLQSWYMQSIWFFAVSKFYPRKIQLNRQPNENTMDLSQVLPRITSGAEQQKSISVESQIPSNQTSMGKLVLIKKESVLIYLSCAVCLVRICLTRPRICQAICNRYLNEISPFLTYSSKFSQQFQQIKKNLLFSLRISTKEPSRGCEFDLRRAICLEANNGVQRAGRQAFLMSLD